MHDRNDAEWTLNRALELLVRVCDVMAHAHSRGVIHRDLKPSNILVGSFGDVRVIDWGSAHVLEQARKDFQTPFVPLNQPVIETDRDEALQGQIASPLSTAKAGQPITALFMPPEILRGDVAQLGPQTDVYSVGVMLYQLLAGRPPYSNPDGSLPDPTELRERIFEAPAGNLNNPLLSTEGCWSGTITPQSSTQWLVNMQSSCTDGSAGVETIGTICFTAISPHSAFVPLTVNSLVISNLAPVHPFGTRVVNIANEPLLEATRGSNKQRLLTTYGKANTAYEIRYATNVSAASPWTLGFTNTVPATLFYSQVLQGTYSNAPVLFLRANEQ